MRKHPAVLSSLKKNHTTKQPRMSYCARSILSSGSKLLKHHPQSPLISVGKFSVCKETRTRATLAPEQSSTLLRTQLDHARTKSKIMASTAPTGEFIYLASSLFHIHVSHASPRGPPLLWIRAVFSLSTRTKCNAVIISYVLNALQSEALLAQERLPFPRLANSYRKKTLPL